ncbi:MAG: FecR domain-containing protein [Thiotrichales bacterium]|nr:FecR domain-containing protein [Thiotrichales bacterium]
MLHFRVSLFLLLWLTSYSVLAEAGVVAFSVGDTSVKKGQLIEVGQTITTGNNGHVHIRFIDGAKLSLRPNTVLTVETYRYDPENPENNRVKLFLEKGVARSISGEAGKQNKEGFRMNTPISAIGIRGTDYTVSTTAQRTQVFVNAGGVGISPFGETCRAEDFGVCHSPELVELVEGDSHVLEIRNQRERALLMDLDNALQNPDLYLSDGNQKALFLDDDTLLPVNPNNSQTPEIGWGHWRSYQPILGRLFIPMTPYLTSDWRVVSINQFFGLFLPDKDPQLPKTGQLDFRLDRYQAFSVVENQVESAQLSNPSFSVNLSERSFHAAFTVSSSLLQTQLNGTGTLDNIGFLRFSDGNSSISGALNRDLTQAGLLFEKTLNENQKVLGSSAWIKK